MSNNRAPSEPRPAGREGAFKPTSCRNGPPPARWLRENLLEQPVLVMHAGLARTRVDLPGKTDDVTRLKERLDQTNGTALEAVVDVGIKDSM